MSDTDKTRPYWVKVTEIPMVTCVPSHNHTTGVCDLSEDPADDFARPWSRRRCYWTWSERFCASGQARCGCPMCTGKHERRAERRGGRHQARVEARGWVRDWREEYDAWVSA